MAEVFLGFEDEPVQDQSDLTYLSNKIGGLPNWPPSPGLELDTRCNVCHLPRPLVLQCYVPLPNSPYHRTLYVYGCINPSCWNNSNSWSCYRSQYLDENYGNILPSNTNDVKTPVVSAPWCSGADEWDDDEDITQHTNTPQEFSVPSSSNQITSNIERMSDSDEEPSEMEQIEASVGNISLANNSESGQCSRVITEASAQIDGNESEVVTDMPTLPDNNIFALLTQVPELPETLTADNASIQFVSKFVSVYQEYLEDGKSDHVKELLDLYEKEHSDDLKKVTKVKGKSSKNSEVEEYEKAIPLHGDEVFHNFLTRIQMNPTQILRYCSGGKPLPMSPLPSSLHSSKCSHCGGDNWFELQILPTIIPSLRIPNSTSTHLEFGTVLIYACKQSCWRKNDKILSETVFVQSEPV